MIRDMPPDRIGAFVDPSHMTLEGAVDGWRQSLDLLAPWIGLAAIKNFWWEKTSRDEAGQQRWRFRWCPLSEGVAPIRDFVSVLRRVGYEGFYSLHSEYKSGNSYRQLTTIECIEQTKKDLAFFPIHVTK